MALLAADLPHTADINAVNFSTLNLLHHITVARAQQPAAAKEQQYAGGSAKRDPAAGDLLAADASRTEARKGQKQQTEQFGVKGRREESRRPLEVHQDLIDEGRVPTYGRNPRIGVPVKMNEREQQAERPHELHDFGETPQVVFLLHGFPGLRSSVQRKILRDMSVRPSGAGYGRKKERNEPIFRKNNMIVNFKKIRID